MIFSVHDEMIFSTKETPTFIENRLNVIYFISIHSYVFGEKPLYKSLTFKSKNVYCTVHIRDFINFIIVSFAPNV